MRDTRKQEDKTEKNLHAGHRKRMLERLKKQDLLEHEELEVLLFNALPRMNTNDIAHRLLARFGSFDGVLDASIEELMQVRGIGESLAAYLRIVGVICERRRNSHPTQYGGNGSPESFFPYVQATYKGIEEEVVDAYLLGGNGYVYKRERIQCGDEGHVVFDPVDLTKVFIEEKPAGLILVHNHPKGSAKPSEKDVAMTKKLQLICSTYNVLLCDHVIYAPNGIYSFYHEKQLQGISSKFSLSVLSEEVGNGKREEK